MGTRRAPGMVHVHRFAIAMMCIYFGALFFSLSRFCCQAGLEALCSMPRICSGGVVLVDTTLWVVTAVAEQC